MDRDKRSKVEAIRGILSDLSLWDALEVIANVLIFEGLAFMDYDRPATSASVMNIATEDMKKHGPTPANSAVLYGINILEALDRDL